MLKSLVSWNLECRSSKFKGFNRLDYPERYISISLSFPIRASQISLLTQKKLTFFGKECYFKPVVEVFSTGRGAGGCYRKEGKNCYFLKRRKNMLFEAKMRKNVIAYCHCDGHGQSKNKFKSSALEYFFILRAGIFLFGAGVFEYFFSSNMI